MSLITDDLLLKLWEKAQEQSSDARASAKLWNHLWGKHFFSETNWVLSQKTVENGDRQRVDITIERMGEDGNLTVVVFHEANALEAVPKEVQKAEGRVYDACMRYLGENPGLQFAYAFTSSGSKGKAWRCVRGGDRLLLLFEDHSQYVEVHSQEGEIIKRAAQEMRLPIATLP
ncbi:hypothetical protein BO94DRAFT_306916 [Aspergillus sclerotioniger CBS 115572]|uniref:Uncharacterized protein n=1 Tax=Aspergillus sclerotioniger CBS 115572 TaxID=1450535 RepID=A0A317V1T8_9EURO|nr:hypothetical protein BO94DRAFT_306916 [Aspergillus sclerotioniger CBS 115572]PWY67609.1 hypothetical protein BO94DRAFT_306916 [Aspergillus sclerotioniger CBS 115572]